ncbi:MAG: DUF2269 domain-containing protein [Spirochaetia bacterium]|nr:DUF2269 domain-containing protein [Spirochaetia bacterium]
MDYYVLIRGIHILGAVILLGNIAVTGVWKILADRTKNPFTVAYAQKLVIITDFIFTLPGSIMLFVTGFYFLSEKYGGIADNFWILLSFSLFILSGAVWIAVLVPVQFKQLKMAKQFQDGDTIPKNYFTLSFIWNAAGMAATVIPFFILYLMLTKPESL